MARLPAGGRSRSARGQQRPVTDLLDLLGRRWTLRVSWELRDGALPFNELQRRCDMVSPSVLNQRLREGVEAGTIVRDEDGRYRLSPSGRSLMELLLPLSAWADRWARRRGRAPKTPRGGGAQRRRAGPGSSG